MKGSILNSKWLWFSFSFFVLVIVWVVWSQSVNNSLVAPSPTQTLVALKTILGSKNTYQIIGWSLGRLFLALLLSISFGFILGFLSGINSIVEKFFYPIVTVLRTIPVIAIILILLMAFGKDKSPLAITFLMIFPITYEAILGGIKELNKEEYMEVYKLDSKMNFRVFWNVYRPLVFPFFKMSLIQSIGMGVKVLVMAEFTSGCKNSIGLEILHAYNNIEFDKIFAWTFLLILFVLFIEYLISVLRKQFVKEKNILFQKEVKEE